LISIKRNGSLITATLKEDYSIKNVFTCDRRTINQAIALTNILKTMVSEGKGFVTIRNMMEYDKI
jgi:hypothetical protein